jgi:hypothetical protein
MVLRWKKVRDGVVLTCLRQDGSVETQRTAHGGFFALHDLMHYAVESVLGIDLAFYGLLRSGWSFATFSDHTDPRYAAMPREAVWVEHLVGILSRSQREECREDPELLVLFTDEINEGLRRETKEVAVSTRVLTPGEVRSICARFSQLAGAWASVPLGEHLELEFPDR